MVTSGRADPAVGHENAPPGRREDLEVPSRMPRRLARRLLDALRRDLAGLRASVTSPLGVRPGLFTYRVHPPGGTRRIHLRIDADGSGVLLVDVADAIHLNPTAALLARLALDHAPPDRALALLRGRFRQVDPARLGCEAETIYALVEHLATTTDRCPTCGLDELARTPLFGTPARAPYKADLALTYGCNNACRHCYNPRERAAMRSLSSAGWRRVLKKLARVGVPHVIFTGGEPTLVDGLPELIRHARRLGLVTGVNTNNREGKRVRTRYGWGRRAATKRAIVTVAAGERIDIFGGPVS